MPDHSRNPESQPIRIAPGAGGEATRPMLTLYRGDAEGPHDQLANPYRPADVDAWPVDAPTAADPRLAVFQRPDSAQAKAYRVLRHRLLGLDNPRVVLVTSAVAGEGKSAVAANLALALAEEVTTRVLLVEANAKRPSLSALFQFIPPRCFLEQVAELAVTQPRWTVAELMGTRLHLAAIDPDSSHPRSIDRVLFAAAMRQLRRSYDYVIIDGPAALETADVNAAADAADGTLLVSIAKKSSRRALARALEQLKPAPILGVALLGAGREGSRDGS